MLLQRFTRCLSNPRSRGIQQSCCRRSLSSIHSPHRPSLLGLSPTSSQQVIPTARILDSTIQLDLLPKISSHPGLIGTQIRCGPRDTFSPSHFVRKRRVGFLARKRTRSGRKILKARQLKGRRSLSH